MGNETCTIIFVYVNVYMVLFGGSQRKVTWICKE